jgi:hypothetical protein
MHDRRGIDGGRQPMLEGADASFSASTDLVPDVQGRARIITDQNHREARNQRSGALKRFNPATKIRTQLLRDGAAVDYSGSNRTAVRR